jgi:uncharacterized membrane protein (DUF106 family)
MDRALHLRFCKQCTLSKFDRNKGIICSLTSEHANFENNCSDYQVDEKEKTHLEWRLEQEKQRKIEDDSMGLHKIGITNPVYVSITVIILAITWIFIGIFFLEGIFIIPIIVFFVGVGIVIKGLMKKKKIKNLGDILDLD